MRNNAFETIAVLKDTDNNFKLDIELRLGEEINTEASIVEVDVNVLYKHTGVWRCPHTHTEEEERQIKQVLLETFPHALFVIRDGWYHVDERFVESINTEGWAVVPVLRDGFYDGIFFGTTPSGELTIPPGSGFSVRYRDNHDQPTFGKKVAVIAGTVDEYVHYVDKLRKKDAHVYYHTCILNDPIQYTDIPVAGNPQYVVLTCCIGPQVR